MTTDEDLWCWLGRELRRRLSRRGRREAIEDASQEALLTMLLAKRAGVTITDPMGFVFRIAVRRLVDARRQVVRQALVRERLQHLNGPVSFDSADWLRRLDAVGLTPTPAWREILACIQAGIRTSGGMAKAIHRDRSTIRERRERLVQPGTWVTLLTGHMGDTREGPTEAAAWFAWSCNPRSEATRMQVHANHAGRAG